MTHKVKADFPLGHPALESRRPHVQSFSLLTSPKTLQCPLQWPQIFVTPFPWLPLLPGHSGHQLPWLTRLHVSQYLSALQPSSCLFFFFNPFDSFGHWYSLPSWKVWAHPHPLLPAPNSFPLMFFFLVLILQDSPWLPSCRELSTNPSEGEGDMFVVRTSQIILSF